MFIFLLHYEFIYGVGRLFPMRPFEPLDLNRPLSQINGPYDSGKARGFAEWIGGSTVFMLPHWRRYTLHYIQTNTLAYTFRFGTKTDTAWKRLTRTPEIPIPLIMEQPELSPTPPAGEVDPTLSVDREMEWGLLDLLWLNPFKHTATVFCFTHLLYLAILSGAAWIQGVSVMGAVLASSLTTYLVLTVFALLPLAIYWTVKHMQAMGRIEDGYAREQNLVPWPWTFRMKMKLGRVDGITFDVVEHETGQPVDDLRK